jgi:hypothetical protein
MRSADSLSVGPGISQDEHLVPSEWLYCVLGGEYSLNSIETTLGSITLVLALATLENLAVPQQHRQLVRLTG